MSNQKPAVDNVVELEGTPSRIQRAKTFVQTHKKATIAVAALTGLVVVSAITGRAKASESPVVEDAAEDQDETVA